MRFSSIHKFIGASLLMISTAVHAEQIEISVGVVEGQLANLQELNEFNPETCQSDEVFEKEWNRQQMSFLIFCRAVQIGGVQATFTFKSYPNYARTLAEVKRGSFMVMNAAPWQADGQNENLYQSAAVLKNGMFVKGVYTRADHPELHAIKERDDWRKFTAVSNDNWLLDWNVLIDMGVGTTSVGNYVMMARMVHNSRADFMLASFPSNPDLTQTIGGVELVPVQGIKVNLPASRHFVMSKNVENSGVVFEALGTGLRVLEGKGLVDQGYANAGYPNPNVNEWNTLCCE